MPDNGSKSVFGQAREVVQVLGNASSAVLLFLLFVGWMWMSYQENREEREDRREFNRSMSKNLERQADAMEAIAAEAKTDTRINQSLLESWQSLSRSIEENQRLMRQMIDK